MGRSRPKLAAPAINRSGNRSSQPELVLVATLGLLCVLFVSGCPGQGSFEIDAVLMLTVLKALKVLKNLQFAPGETLPAGQVEAKPHEMMINRHKAWFICRRAEKIGKRHPTENAIQLASRINPQFDEVENYLDSKLGTGKPLSSFVDTTTPGGASPALPNQHFMSSNKHHFDLNDIARPLTTSPLGTTRNRYLTERHIAVRVIAWHAAGLHDSLWKKDNPADQNEQIGDGKKLDIAAMDEIVDRRLRSIERMRYQINGGKGSIPLVPPPLGRGPWIDKSRVRVFEYPYFKPSLVSAGDIFDTSIRPAPPPNPAKIWTPLGNLVRYRWPAPNGLATRFDVEPSSNPNNVSQDWPPAPPPSDRNYIRVKGNGSIAAALDSLFISALDIWDRTWLLCDHSIAATHMEAFRFSLLRRPNADDFDLLLLPKSPYLGGILWAPFHRTSTGELVVDQDGSLFNDGVAASPTDASGFFDTLFVNYRDLQVGDHLVLWSHHLYLFVARGPWRLENAFVTELDVRTDGWDQKGGKAPDPAVLLSSKPEGLFLSGFGAQHNYPEFIQELYLGPTNALGERVGGVKQAFDAIARTVPETGTSFKNLNTAADSLMIQWTPYSTGILGTSDKPQQRPWWIFLRRIPIGNKQGAYLDKVDLKLLTKHSVIEGANRGAGYQPIPTTVTIATESGNETFDITDGVMFPLFLPVVSTSRMKRQIEWDEYFELRRTDPSVVAELVKIEFTFDMMPGLFVRGQNMPIQVIRPRVRPSPAGP